MPEERRVRGRERAREEGRIREEKMRKITLNLCVTKIEHMQTVQGIALLF